jgi:hypothetical protein
MKFGPSFTDEILAAGLGGLKFVWSRTRGTITGRENLTDEQNKILDEVIKAHDPTKIPRPPDSYMTQPEKLGAWADFGDDMPELAPVVATEMTEDGWRGVTAEGEIFLVRAQRTEGEEAKPPESVVVNHGGKLIGRRRVADNVVSVADYMEAFDRARVLHRANSNEEALAEINKAIAVVSTARARFNRAMMLLSLGRWREGFEEFEEIEREPPFLRPNAQRAMAAGIAPWRDEPIEGKRLLIVHDHGFGDTIMMLRFVEAIGRIGNACFVLAVPPELQKIAAQFGAIVEIESSEADYFTSFLHLMRWLEVEPENIPTEPYVAVESNLVARWRDQLGPTERRRVGVAWSVGFGERDGDFPRALPLAEIIARYPDAEFHSVQTQGRDEAHEHGVLTHDLYDFASTAALMLSMDEIATVDTAAVHLAGAIGHKNVTLLLSRWHSWRWYGNPFYPEIQIVESGR